MSAFRSTARATATIGLIGAMLCYGGAANAETPASQHSVSPVAVTTESITPEQAQAALDELRVSMAGQHTIDSSGSESFQLTDGVSMRFEKDASQRIGGGMDGWKPYVEFNHTEQGLLITGASAALKAAICAIPAVGPIACVVAKVLISVAAAFVKTKRCPGHLRVTVDSARCV